MLEVSSWVCVVSLVQFFMEFDVISELRSRDIEKLRSDNSNSLSSENLLGDFGSKSTVHVTSCVYDQLLFEHT